MAPLIVRADSTTNQTTDGVRQVEIHQAQIKTQVQQAADDLTSIITELQRNGIGGDDISVLQNIHGSLDDMSAGDMAKVIALLQQARAGDATQWHKQTSQADVDQAQILTKMQKVLLEYKHQQDLYEMSLRINDLAQRQNANFKEAKQMMRSVGAANNADVLNDLQKSSVERQTAEQQAIANQAKMLTDKLSQMAAQSDPKTAERLKQCLDQANQQRLDDSLSAAVGNLKESKFGAAASAQKNARDSLYDLASLVAAAQDPATRLAKAAEKLDQALAEQKGVLSQTHDLSPQRDDADRDGFYQAEDRQADNVDLVDRLRKNIDVMAPAVTDSLKNAENQMQEARGSLNAFQQDQSLQRERDGLNALQQAKQQLDQQMAQWDAQKHQGDTLAQSQALKQKIADALQKQQEINNQSEAKSPDAAKLAKAQSDESKETRDLQSESASQSMPTAKELAAAADDMDAAKSNLEQKSLAGAKPSEHSAAEHLAEAQKQLDQQIEKLQKDQQDLAQMQHSRQQVAKLIEDQQKVALNTARQTARQSNQSPSATQPSPHQPQPQSTQPATQPDNRSLAQQQSDVSKQTEATRQSLPQASQSASPSLDQAHQEMDNAQNALQQQQSKAATSAQQQALNNLQQAKSQLDQQIAQKQQELGQPQDQQQQMEQLSQQLRQTQQDLNSAQEQMDQSSPQQSADRMANAANQVTSTTANDQGALPTLARQNLQLAQQELNQASGDAQANQQSNAKSHAQAGQNAISQALDALSQAQKGNNPPKQNQNSETADSQPPPQQQQNGKSGNQSSADNKNQPKNNNGQSSQQGSGNRKNISPETAATGPNNRANVTGSSSYLALPARDRQAIEQTQNEKYPQEYAPAVEEYLKNLSDQDNR